MNLLVFDIDDTLTKSEDQHVVAYASAMRSMGIQKVDENWSNYKHYTDSYILKVNYENNFNQVFDLALIPEFEADMLKKMLSLKTVEGINGASNFVNYLRNEGQYAIAFATGSLYKPAILKLQQAGIWHEENLVAAANNFYEREQIVLDAIAKAQQYYGVQKFDNIIAAGDGLWDMNTAKNLGLHFIAIGQKHLQKFKQENVLVHTNDWTDFDFDIVEQILFK